MDRELAYAAAYAPGRRCVYCVVSKLKWRYGRHLEISEIRLRQTMDIYLKTLQHAKSHPDPIWNDEDLGFLKRSSQQEQQNNSNKMSNANEISSWSKNRQHKWVL